VKFIKHLIRANILCMNRLPTTSCIFKPWMFNHIWSPLSNSLYLQVLFICFLWLVYVFSKSCLAYTFNFCAFWPSLQQFCLPHNDILQTLRWLSAWVFLLQLPMLTLKDLPQLSSVWLNCNKILLNLSGYPNPYNGHSHSFGDINLVSHSHSQFGHWFVDGKAC
jgi:hypothetical protein